MNGFPLLLRIFIWTYPVYFSVIKFPSATLMYLSVSTIDTGIKYEISGVMWQVAPESKIQLVSCELYPKYLLELSSLEYIRAIDAYIFCESFCSVLLYKVLSIFFNLYKRFWRFLVFMWSLFSGSLNYGQSTI